jgi:hypothetical protein
MGKGRSTRSREIRRDVTGQQSLLRLKEEATEVSQPHHKGPHLSTSGNECSNSEVRTWTPVIITLCLGRQSDSHL